MEKKNQKKFGSMDEVLQFYSKPRKKKQPDAFADEDDILIMIEEKNKETNTENKILVSIFHRSKYAQNTLVKQNYGKQKVISIDSMDEAIILNNGSTKTFLIIKRKSSTSATPKR